MDLRTCRSPTGRRSPTWRPSTAAPAVFFPIDEETIRYLELSGRPREQIDLVEAYAKRQGFWRTRGADCGAIHRGARARSRKRRTKSRRAETAAGPGSPAHRKATYRASLKKMADERTQKGAGGKTPGSAPVTLDGQKFDLKDGAVLIAAITSCTNTSNPSVMLGAGLLARNARRLGLKAKPWVKTSLAPGSRVVTDYFQRAGLLEELASVGFDLVGYGCTTCIGNCGPLQPRDFRGREGGRSRSAARCSREIATSKDAFIPRCG